MGGHWKRIDTMLKGQANAGYSQPTGDEQPRFNANRGEVVSRCIDLGINLIDACTGGEVMAYAKALKGRRDKMFLNYSWFEKEMRSAEWRKAEKLLQGLDEGLKEAGLEYVDLWRVTCLEKGGNHTEGELQELVGALDKARKQGKCRFTGVSSHDRPWLKKIIEKYPETIQVIVSPYTAGSRVLPKDSLFESVIKNDVGFLGIKPFGSNSLFKGDSALDSATREEDDKVARMAIRYILCNPAISAPIPGLINTHQVRMLRRR
jgi:aryl-alcohol dehydrogenase-like predicted oxidoreductase